MKSPAFGTKITLWLLALALILACAPAVVTPVVLPLDPNAVQLFLQQTAAAASTQTQRAIPTSSITPTFTSTPRNTFTPEATFTPFQTFVLPSPQNQTQTVQYFRVKHDHQLAIYDFKSRTEGPNWSYREQTPEILPMFTSPSEGSGTHRTPVSGAWESYIDALNGNNEGRLIYLKSSGTALFNGAGFPQMESLTMGGNIITLEAIQNGWGKVHTMDFSQPGNAAVENYFTRPDLVHKFVLVSWNTKNKTTIWPKTQKGDIYYPFVTRNDVWVQMERLEPFPILPMVVTANEAQDLRMEPKLESELTGFELAKGDSVRIVQYSPSGSVVWGRLESGRWIMLFFYEGGVPKYLTSWSMATDPPP